MKISFQIALLMACLCSVSVAHSEQSRSLLPSVPPDIFDALLPAANRTLTEPERTQRLARLHALPDWEERLGEAIAKLAIKSRYDGKYIKLMEEWSRLPNEKAAPLGVPPSATELRARELSAMVSQEIPNMNRARDAWSELADIFNLLTRSKDSRAVAFIGPILSENALPIVHDLVDTLEPMQEHAAYQLGGLRTAGVLPPETPGRYSADLDKWRTWWKENRRNYEPIPAALAALEATEGGTKPTPAPSTPVPVSTPAPATPVPESPGGSPRPASAPSVQEAPPWGVVAVTALIAIVLAWGLNRRGR